ncbi:MAG: YgjV family protein [Alphaproteobacteria bacterium]
MFLESTELLPQACGYIALFLGVIAYQFKESKAMLAVQSIMNIFWFTHFFLIGAHVGALMSCVGLFRNSSACLIAEKHLPKIAITSCILALSLGLYAAESWIYLTACGGNILNNISIIAREKPLTFRLIQFAGESLWLLYSILVMSLPGIAFGLFLIISNAIGTLRHEKNAIAKSLLQKSDHPPSRP